MYSHLLDPYISITCTEDNYVREGVSKVTLVNKLQYFSTRFRFIMTLTTDATFKKYMPIELMGLYTSQQRDPISIVNKFKNKWIAYQVRLLFLSLCRLSRQTFDGYIYEILFLQTTSTFYNYREFLISLKKHGGKELIARWVAPLEFVGKIKLGDAHAICVSVECTLLVDSGVFEWMRHSAAHMHFLSSDVWTLDDLGLNSQAANSKALPFCGTAEMLINSGRPFSSGSVNWVGSTTHFVCMQAALLRLLIFSIVVMERDHAVSAPVFALPSLSVFEHDDGGVRFNRLVGVVDMTLRPSTLTHIRNATVDEIVRVGACHRKRVYND